MKAREAIPYAIYCVLAMTAAGAQAQLVGTLFTQPEEREYLDYLREEFLRNNAAEGFDIEETAIPEIPVAEATEPSGPTELSFGGIMTRRDASRSVWLNGRLLEESELPDGISLMNGERTASLLIAYEGDTYVLRPGQTVDLTTGNVLENFQRAPLVPVAGTAPAQPPPAVDATLTQPALAEEAAAAGAVVAPATTTQENVATTPAGIEADPVSPLAAAILRLTPLQSSELAARLNDQAEAANTEAESEDADD